MRVGYAVAGAAVAVVIDLALNLLAAILQARTPVEQIAQLSVGWLVVLVVAGLLAGVWLSGKIAVPPALPNSTTVLSFCMRYWFSPGFDDPVHQSFLCRGAGRPLLKNVIYRHH